jgi:hypothetical protein
MGFDADLAAVFQKQTLGTSGPGAGADISSERNEKRIELTPITPGERFLELKQGFFGSRSADVSPAVDDSMNMNVHADALLAACYRQDQVCAFGADPFEGKEHVPLARNPLGKLCLGPKSDLANGFGLPL